MRVSVRLYRHSPWASVNVEIREVDKGDRVEVRSSCVQSRPGCDFQADDRDEQQRQEGDA